MVARVNKVAYLPKYVQTHRMFKGQNIHGWILILALALTGCGGGNSTGGSGGGGGGGGGSATATGAHPPFKTRYIRTDLQYDPNILQYFPPHFTTYDSAHKRFFMSNTTQNSINVFDPSSESQIGTAVVPLPFGLDIAPDSSKLYVATTFGDVYVVDPETLAVVQRYPSATIGPSGYTATQVLVLADGRLVLMGGFGGVYPDGSESIAIWDPVLNTITDIPTGLIGPNFGQFALSGDRTKILVSGAYSQQLAYYDTVSGTSIISPFSGGGIINIAGTPDGKRFFVFGGDGGEIFDADTMAELGTFQVPGANSILSHDGSSLFSPDEAGNVIVYDCATNSLLQKGWIPNFRVLDLQSSLVMSAIDENGLITGPIGHGVAFLDSTQVRSGTEGSGVSVSFLTPPSGPTSGNTSVEANYDVPVGVNVTTGTVYIGNASASNITFSPTAITATSPKSSFSGVADFTVILPNGSMDIMPEDFSFGPTIVEVSTNAASSEGGAQAAIYGYGLGENVSQVQVSVGGQSAQVTQVFPSVAPIFPYPFPMQAVVFSVPPGTSGAAENITVTTPNGTASATNAFHYLPAVQSFPLSGSALMQGTYDAKRAVMYFTNQREVEVFSPASKNWLSPIAIPSTNGNSRLIGVALSPDNNTLAVSDAGNSSISILNPSSPLTVKSFNVNTGSEIEPFGLAVTNSGSVYYATFDLGSNQPGLYKLDTNTEIITNFEPVKNGDEFVRVLLTPDGAHVFVNDGSGDAGIWVIDTIDDSLSEGLQATIAGDGNEDATLSLDGSTLLASDLLMDDGLNVFGDITYVDRDVWLPLAVYGQKLSGNGNLAFQPLTDGIDIHDATSGLLQYRVELPITFSNVYDALAIDNANSLFYGLTENGIVQIDLSGITGSLVRNKDRKAQHRNYRPYAGNRAAIRHDVVPRPHLQHPEHRLLRYSPSRP